MSPKLVSKIEASGGSQNCTLESSFAAVQFAHDSSSRIVIYVVRGALIVNIQIFGTKKSSDTRKAERFFKERGIKFQSIDLKEKGLSKGEFNSVMQAVGGVDAMIDSDCKDKDLLALVTYISADERAEKVMKNQSVIRQPIVRNGRQATVGYAPDVWKTWQ